MHKPPPDRESLIADLWKVHEKHFHGYPHTLGSEQRAIRNAIAALNTPKSAQELADALQNQSHVVDAAGWPGAASLMRDAARRIGWHLQHGVKLPSATIPLPVDELVKELVRFAKSEGSEYTQSVLYQAAKIISETIDKPKDDTDLTGYDDLDIVALLTYASDSANSAKHVTEEIIRINGFTAKDLAQRAVQYLNAAIKKLDG
jgi:hypothetical protein